MQKTGSRAGTGSVPSPELSWSKRVNSDLMLVEQAGTVITHFGSPKILYKDAKRQNATLK